MTALVRDHGSLRMSMRVEAALSDARQTGHDGVPAP
jgi:hypothetical protein